ncbi:MAG: type II toxin-antitoxin system VapC family toxin [Magnetococcales bacterium]|nr:type II toxin-antitoxin system VapC family toxin [Magnetococcales bacterium]
MDTNHCVYLMNALRKMPSNRTAVEQNVVYWFVRNRYFEFFLSDVTLGELWFGAARSSRRESNFQSIELLCKTVTPLPVTTQIWREFGEQKALLREQRLELGDFDLLIACTASVHGLVLVTRDADFQVLGTGYVFRENWANSLPMAE